MAISLCRIIKNEEDWIEGAAQSVRSIVSEVIIVNTASTDSTPSRIQALGAKAFKSRWKDSFAQARNVSLAEAGQPRILVLDDYRTRAEQTNIAAGLMPAQDNQFHGGRLK